MADIDISEYIPAIKEILMTSDHLEITARDVRLKLEQEYKVDLTSRKHEVQRLVEKCFDDLDIKISDSDTDQVVVKEEVEVKKEEKHVHTGDRRHKSSVKSREKSKSKSKKSQKSRVKYDMSDYSSLEDEKPTPKGKRVVKRLWMYIKENELQDPNDKRYIVCDEKLMSIFKHERIHSFTMNKYLTDHLKKKEDLVVKVEQGNLGSINGNDHDYTEVKTEVLDDEVQQYGSDYDHGDYAEVKAEAQDETQFDDEHSEVVNANAVEFGEDDGDDEEEWTQY
ncbi:13061_t:CDS:2 [Acaulospora colombiana]|uniref:13061_t:CDS:1 n=1 Tax=Acaulospora colombiana TaxID=27376 RepID=A0ACA9LGZ0_9GLOM|nr:13061_t:CDS:2 [Acaulospora colombiana]